MLKLGLLGTVIGFILMLSSIQSIDSFDVETLKGALTSMSGGMGVALFTTLFGLVGGILLKLQYYILDEGTSYLFGLITELTEVYVVPVLNRVADDGAI
jgi:biopolymer transport protein ExbB/TolQ